MGAYWVETQLAELGHGGRAQFVVVTTERSMNQFQHLSYSSLSTYLDCAGAKKGVAFGVPVQKVQTPATPSLVFGSAFHGAIEGLLRQWHTSLTSGVLEPPEMWQRCWAQAGQQEMDWQGEMPEELANLGLRMLTHKDTTRAH